MSKAAEMYAEIRREIAKGDKWYYAGCYGKLNEEGGLHFVPGTSDKKEMFKRAQETANKVGKPVFVTAKRGDERRNYIVNPK